MESTAPSKTSPVIADTAQPGMAGKGPVSPMRASDWIITLAVLFLPLVNIIVYLYWAFFSANTHPHRRTFCWFCLVGLTLWSWFIKPLMRVLQG